MWENILRKNSGILETSFENSLHGLDKMLGIMQAEKVQNSPGIQC